MTLVRLLPLAPFCAAILCAQSPPAPAPTSPDLATVQRHGAGWRYTQDGWIVVHIEGAPYERGVQHGWLLADELATGVRLTGAEHAHGSPEDGWKADRLLCNALFLRGYDPEYLEEMRGIADGANAAGARAFGRPFDVLDIATLNSEVETSCLPDGLEGLPTGLEGRAAHRPGDSKGDRCSAFVATGPATKDGRIVIGHITMSALWSATQTNVWLDVQPSQGHRVVMQTSAGCIWSGTDWYLNDAGIALTETTIGQTRFDRNGTPLASRARRAMQYGDSIDSVVAALQAHNNGLYSNEWLLADTRRNEIAMFELGTAATRLWRSSKDEWVSGTKGFYWGCNNERQVELRLEQMPGALTRPRDLVCHATDRDCKWLQVFDQWQGRIDDEFARVAFTTPPLASSHAFDAKYATAAMIDRLQCVGLFGPPRGATWSPSKAEQAQFAELQPLVYHDWTVLAPLAAPPAAPATAAHDLGVLPPAHTTDDEHHGFEPAWYGTVLAAGEADAWLPIALAAHEHHVAAVHALTEPDEKARAENVAAGRWRAGWQHAVRRLGHDVPLPQLRADPRRADWFEIAAGKGALLLQALRDQLGDERYCAAMDAFGRAHAGQPVATAAFTAFVAERGGDAAAALCTQWLSAEVAAGAPVWTVRAFEDEPEQALIVYGTAKEAPANREAAMLLQRRIASSWYNYDVLVVADREVADADLKSHHLVLVGRPAANAVAARLLAGAAFPVAFGADSFAVAGQTFAHERSGVVAAGANPRGSRWSLVVYAGNSSDATRALVQEQPEDAEVVVAARGQEPRAEFVTGAPAVGATNAAGTRGAGH